MGLRRGVKSGRRRVKPILGLSATGSRIWIIRMAERDLAACGRMGQLVRSRAPAEHGTGRMSAVFWLIDTIIDIYIWLLIAQAILSWLLAFGVVNRYNRGVAVISDFLYRITEPVLRPIRSFLPNFGGIDISPVILILLLMFLRRLILYDLAPAFF
jgi:YggT family protein